MGVFIMQSFFSKVSVLLGSLLALATASFGYIHYTNQPTQSASHGTISLHCHPLDKNQCIARLGRHMPKAEFQPIELHITNNSDRHLAFSTNTISGIKIVPAKHAAKENFYNTTGRAIGWGVAGLFMPLLWIPGAIHYASGVKANNKILNNFIKHGLTEHCIWSGNSLTGMIFVDAHYTHNATTLCFFDTSTGEQILCPIDMSKSTNYIYNV